MLHAENENAALRADYFDVVRRAKRQYARNLEPICAQHGLTRNELDVLLFLYNNPDFDRAADIVERRGMAKSHVSLSVAGLRRRGLLQFCTDPTDRRTVHLQLSQDAREIAEQGRQAQHAFFSRLFATLSQDDIALWQSIHTRIRDNLTQME